MASDTSTQPTVLYSYTKPRWYRSTWFVALVAFAVGVAACGIAWRVLGSGDTSRAGTQTSFRYGDWVSFPDGSVLSVAKPEEFSRSGGAMGGASSRDHVKVQISFLNRRPEVYDASGTDVRVVSDGRDGDRVLQDGMQKTRAKGLPGSRVTWTAGYGVEDPDQVAVTVDLGFGDDGPVTFVSDSK